MAETEKTVDQLTSQELFEGAMAPPVEPVPAVEPTPLEPVVAPPEPAAAAPAAVVPPAVVPPAPELPDGAIPSWRLKEEAERARAAEDRARALEIRLNQIVTHLQQQQQQPKQGDFFDNPNQAISSMINQALSAHAEDTRKRLMVLGRTVAEARHGEDKVAEAEQAFLKARESEQLDPAEYEQVVGSPNRFDAVVHWHQKHSVLASVGNDPMAWFDKQLEARLADPTFKAKMLEKVREDAATRPSTIKIPPSLSKSTAVAAKSDGSDVAGDLSDQSLFAFARPGR